MRHAALISIRPREAALAALERPVLLRVGPVQCACVRRPGPRAHSGSLPVAAREGNNWNGVPAVRPYLGEAVKSMIQAFLLGALATMFVTAGLFFLRFWIETRDSFFLAF